MEFFFTVSNCKYITLDKILAFVTLLFSYIQYIGHWKSTFCRYTLYKKVHFANVEKAAYELKAPFKHAFKHVGLMSGKNPHYFNRHFLSEKGLNHIR